jgi:hypothetical protein
MWTIFHTGKGNKICLRSTSAVDSPIETDFAGEGSVEILTAVFVSMREA